MRESEIRQAIEEQNLMRESHLGMERDALADVVCEDGFATIVTGVRRSGKSTLLNQWASHRRDSVVSVHFDDIRLCAFENSDFSILDSILRADGIQTLILDEVQDVAGWERFASRADRIPSGACRQPCFAKPAEGRNAREFGGNDAGVFRLP